MPFRSLLSCLVRSGAGTSRLRGPVHPVCDFLRASHARPALVRARHRQHPQFSHHALDKKNLIHSLSLHPVVLRRSCTSSLVQDERLAPSILKSNSPKLLSLKRGLYCGRYEPAAAAGIRLYGVLVVVSSFRHAVMTAVTSE